MPDRRKQIFEAPVDVESKTEQKFTSYKIQQIDLSSMQKRILWSRLNIFSALLFRQKFVSGIKKKKQNKGVTAQISYRSLICIRLLFDKMCSYCVCFLATSHLALAKNPECLCCVRGGSDNSTKEHEST